tara:strand:- start:598 stop:849 length:252 start_codon:yes stop_codon:yes gene_type:complete
MPPKSAQYPCLVLSERAARHLPSKVLSGSKVLSIRASSFHGGGRYDPKLWKERNLDFFQFVLLTTLPQPPEWCAGSLFIVKVA